MRIAISLAVVLVLNSTVALTAPFSWNNPGGGDFNQIFNWNPIGVPGGADTAAYDEFGAYTVTHDGNFTNLSATVSNGIVTFVPDIGAGRTYTLTNDLDIQGTNLNVGGALLPMNIDVGNDLKVGGSGSLIIDDVSSVTTQNLLLGSLASGGNGGVAVIGNSSFNVTGGSPVFLGANGFAGTITVDSNSTVNITGPLELATDFDPGTSGQLFVSSDSTVTLSDVEIGGGTITSSGSFSLSTGGTIDMSGAATLTVGGAAGQGNGTVTLDDDSQMTTGTGLTSILGTGHLDLDDTAMFTANGDLLVDDGLIEGENGTQLLQGPGTTTTIQNGGQVLLQGDWTIQGSGGTRDVVTNAGADVDIDQGLDLGLAGDSAATFTMNDGSVQVGSLVLGPQGNFDYISGSLALGTTSVIGGQFSSATDFDFGFGAVSVTANGVIDVSGTATVGSILNMDGGSFIANELSAVPPVLTFTSGLFQIHSGLTIGNGALFGSSFTITQNHQLKTSGTTTVKQFSILTLDGGLLETGTLANNGTFDFQRGTLRITGVGGLNIGSGGALSTNVVLPTDKILEVTNTATIASEGRLDLSGGQLLANQVQIDGIVAGYGEIAAPLNLSSSGEIRVGAAEQLRVTGGASTNQGKVEVLGGEIEFTSTLTNSGTGLITGRDAVFRFQGGLDNSASVGISFGTSDVFGDVTNQNGATIAASGNSNVTFYDDVVNDGDIQISTGSTAVYFGAVTGIGNFPGAGTNFFEGDLRPGASPAEIDFGGDVVFGAIATLEAEIAGTTPGNEFDVLDVDGTVDLGGTLEVLLLGYNPVLGDNFEIISADGGVNGNFTSELLPGLDPGLMWNVIYGANNVVLEVLSDQPDADFDDDGLVTGLDFLIWQTGLGLSEGATNADGDADFDTDVDSDDLDVWSAQYGTAIPLGSATAAVPEPGSIALALVGLCVASTRHRFG